MAAIQPSIGVITEAFVIGTASTLLAGIFPAWRARKIAIVDALRELV
jgi:ABC-type antimicrobial peptide transport system permease subunit